LRAEVILNGIPVINNVTATLTVPIGTTDLTTVSGYPTDLIVPIWMKEKPVNDDIENYIDMTQRDFLPLLDPDTWIRYWAWIGEKIQVLSCLNAQNVLLYYRRQITTPQTASDSLGWLGAENYLSWRTAAIACASIGELEKGKRFN
jgi:hypothetical protein